MNNKRQTIWLVSMLSLMVILSAYYLFTNDSGPSAPPIAESNQGDNQQTGTTEELVLNEVIPEDMVGDTGVSEEAGSKANDEGAKDKGSDKQDKANDEKGTDKAADPKNPEASGSAEAEDTAKTEEILEQVAAQASSAANKIESYQLDRNNKNMKLYDELITKLGNQESSAEETAQVAEQLKTLEDKESILLSIEEDLQQQYEKAVVKEENDRYNVVVMGDKLDAKAAAGIVDKVMSELKVGQDKVSVQIVTP